MSTCSNIRFIASAGTGKTHQVVSLYQSLLFGRPYPPDDTSLPGQKAGSLFDGQTRVPPEQILMLTFTKNAAAEMRSRVTEAVEQELASGNPANEAFCWSLLRRLSAATISTIHSFAQQLLAAHTLHLGLAPNLAILEDADAHDLRSNEVDASLKAALTSSKAAFVNDLETLCDGHGLKGIHDGILDTILLCSAWGLDLTETEPATLVTQPVAPSVDELNALIKKLKDSTWQKSKKRDDVLTSLTSSMSVVAGVPTGASALASAYPNSSGIIKAAQAALNASKGPWGKSDDIMQLKKEIETSLKAITSYPAQLEASRLLTSFLTLVRQAILRIQGRKRTLGVLDFDDLLFKARELIGRRPSAVPDLKVIIVDEAQDNSRLQNELIQLVQAKTKADMILCGDTKQTIYGWRGADPNGLPEFAKTMRLSDVPLRTSYRSQKGILDWVNDIFAGTVLGPEIYGENETLTPCTAAKALKGPSVELLLPEWEVPPSPSATLPDSKGETKPYITITRNDLKRLAKDDPADAQWAKALEQASQAIALEARAVARRIRLLTSPVNDKLWHPSTVWSPASSQWIKAPASPYRYRDILILLRAGTLQEVYEQALQEEDIPFTTDGKGRGFFARQETLDVSNLLSWLAFPSDRLAWLGLLRSPFVALSDNAIALLEADSASRPLRTSVQTLLQFGLATDAAALERAAPILDHLQQLAGRISSIELIREAVRLTGYDAILAGTFHGVQRLANLQKLLSWLQSHERDETLNLQQTARRLADEISAGRQAPDAAVLDPDDDSVRINTIHAAKGLSSPVVILPDLRRVPTADRNWILVRREKNGEPSGVDGKLKHYVNDTSDDLLSINYKDAQARNKDDRDRESRRLFYVACTRARDLLILSGENPFNGSQNAWRSWINRHLAQINFNPRLITLHPYGDVEGAWRTIAKPTPEQPIPTPADFMAVSAPDSSPQKTERYRFPVTHLASVVAGVPTGASPRINNIRLSLAPVSVTSSSADDHESPEPTATSRAQTGTLAHRILETLDYSSPVPLDDQIDASPEWAEVAPSDRPRIHKQILSAATAIARMISSHPLGDLDAPSGESPHPSAESGTHNQTGLTSKVHGPRSTPPLSLIRELPFAARFDHDGAQVIADGKVDLLFFKDNRWHLVDYKFSDHSPDELKARYSNQLYIYREALSTPAPTPLAPESRSQNPEVRMEDQEGLKSKACHATSVVEGLRSNPPPPSPLRLPRFNCPDASPAEWTLILLSITSDGQCTPIPIEGEPKENLSALLIQSAQTLAIG